MNTEGRNEKGENKNKMDWWMEENGEPVKIPEEVLKYRTEHREIQPDTLVVNEEIKEWTPLKDTQFYKALQAEKTPEEKAPELERPGLKAPVKRVWVCPQCGTSATSIFCPNCGTRKVRPEGQPWLCPSCRTEQTGHRCGKCGLLCPEEKPDERCRALAIWGHILGLLAVLINPVILIPLAKGSSFFYGFVTGMGAENLKNSPILCGAFAIVFGIIALIVNRNYPGNPDKRTARSHAWTGLVLGFLGVILATSSTATL